MDIGALASSLTTALVPLLPYLLKAGEKAAEETGKAVGSQSLEWAKSLWVKLQPKVEAKPAALEAAEDAAQTPDDEDVQATLRRQLKKLLEEDQSLAEEVSRWLEQGKAAGNIVTASASAAWRLAVMSKVARSLLATGTEYASTCLTRTNSKRPSNA